VALFGAAPCAPDNEPDRAHTFYHLNVAPSPHKTVASDLSGDGPDDALDEVIRPPQASVVKVEGLGGDYVTFVVFDGAGEDRLVGLHVVDRSLHSFPGSVTGPGAERRAEDQILVVSALVEVRQFLAFGDQLG
jgi:hypothetical protein